MAAGWALPAALGLVLVHLASGLVSLHDCAFPLLASLYLYAMSKLVFPPVTARRPPSAFAGSLFVRYVIFAGVAGLLLPSAYILGGFALGCRDAVQAAAPHTFLLACQVLSEQLSFPSDAVSMPIRAFLPIFYNARRLFSLSDWIRADFAGGAGIPPSTSASAWLYFGRALSVANMALWNFNLFGFLLPVFLPIAFQQYYQAGKGS